MRRHCEARRQTGDRQTGSRAICNAQTGIGEGGGGGRSRRTRTPTLTCPISEEIVARFTPKSFIQFEIDSTSNKEFCVSLKMIVTLPAVIRHLPNVIVLCLQYWLVLYYAKHAIKLGSGLALAQSSSGIFIR